MAALWSCCQLEAFPWVALCFKLGGLSRDARAAEDFKASPVSVCHQHLDSSLLLRPCWAQENYDGLGSLTWFDPKEIFTKRSPSGCCCAYRSDIRVHGELPPR